jgi:hypothetical protein
MPEELGIPEIIRLGDSWNKCPNAKYFWEWPALRVFHDIMCNSRKKLFIFSYDSSGNLAGTYARTVYNKERMNK